MNCRFDRFFEQRLYYLGPLKHASASTSFEEPHDVTEIDQVRQFEIRVIRIKCSEGPFRLARSSYALPFSSQLSQYV